MYSNFTQCQCSNSRYIVHSYRHTLQESLYMHHNEPLFGGKVGNDCISVLSYPENVGSTTAGQGTMVVTVKTLAGFVPDIRCLCT